MVNSGGISSIKSVHACANHAFLLTKSAKLYAWGYNGYAQLGICGGGGRSFAPTLLNWNNLDINCVVNVYPGKKHTFLTNQADKLYAWGNYAYGHLGVGKITDRTVFKPRSVVLEFYDGESIKDLYLRR